MSHKLIQVEDIGNYKPEQLVMRGKNLVVVGVFRNLAYTSTCNCCYSVVYLDYNGLHGVITTYQNGQVYKNSECYRAGEWEVLYQTF